jgi:hypothetical protein
MPTNSDTWFLGGAPVSKGFMGETQVYPVDDGGGDGGEDQAIGQLHYYIISQRGLKVDKIIPGTTDGVPAWTSDTNKVWFCDENGYATGTEEDKLGAWVSTDDVRTRVTDQSLVLDMLENLPQVKAEPTTYGGRYEIAGWDTAGLLLDKGNLGTPSFSDARVCFPGNPHYPSGFVYVFHSTPQDSGGYSGANFTYEQPFQDLFTPGNLCFHLVTDEPFDWLPTTFTAGRALMEKQVREGLITQEDLDEVLASRKERGLL